MLYNGVFGCHGNMCYVIFIGAIFYMIYSIGPINVCTDCYGSNMAQIVVFVFSVTLTFGLCSIFCNTHCA